MRVKVASETVIGDKHELYDRNGNKIGVNTKIKVKWSLRVYDDDGNLVSMPTVWEEVDIDELGGFDNAVEEARRRLKAKVEAKKRDLEREVERFKNRMKYRVM